MRALMGPARTKLLLLGGQKFTADEAFAYGLIDRIVAPELIEASHRLTPGSRSPITILGGL